MRGRRSSSAWTASIVGGSLFVSAIAHADRVAVLHARGAVPDADKSSIDRAIDVALHALGHTSPTPSEVIEGEGAAGGSIDTSAGLVAVGKTTQSDWVVVPKVIAPGAHGRIELEACQVSSGRIETLARDVDTTIDLSPPLRDMLALLLRPQGVGDDLPPWETKPPSPSEPHSEATSKPPPPPTPPASANARPSAAYAEASAFFVGLGGGAYDLVTRPSGASGSRFAGTWSAVAGFTFNGGHRAPIVEALVRGGGVFGPGNAVRVEVGSRAMVPLVDRLALGGGASIGVFSTTGDVGTTRVLLGLTGSFVVALSTHVAIDVGLASIRWAPGHDRALLFVGAEAGVLARF